MYELPKTIPITDVELVKLKEWASTESPVGKELLEEYEVSGELSRMSLRLLRQHIGGVTQWGERKLNTDRG